MLVLADRNRFGFKLWQIACAGGAKLVCCAKADRKLPVEHMPNDSSHLSIVFESEEALHRRHRPEPALCT